jgi:aromatic-L-amino-acid decarboxylase
LGALETADDPADYALELTRDFRALRLWLPFALHGVSRIREALREKLELATELAGALGGVDGIASVQRELSVVTFRANDDHATSELVARVNKSGHTFISAVELGGAVWARVCVLSVRSHRADVMRAIDQIATALRQ